MFIVRFARFMILMLLFDEMHVDLCNVMLDLHECVINPCFWNHWIFLESLCMKIMKIFVLFLILDIFLRIYPQPSSPSHGITCGFLCVSCGFIRTAWACMRLGLEVKRPRFVWRPGTFEILASSILASGASSYYLVYFISYMLTCLHASFYIF